MILIEAAEKFLVKCPSKVGDNRRSSCVARFNILESNDACSNPDGMNLVFLTLAKIDLVSIERHSSSYN